MNKDIEVVPFFEFKECKTEKEYIMKYLGKTPTDDAYQLAYDMSNDWLKDAPDWEDIQTAFKVGIKVGREQLSDELDALNMKYLSQVSLYKSLYNEEKKKNMEQKV